MENKSRIITLAVFVIIILSGFLYSYFSEDELPQPNIEVSETSMRNDYAAYFEEILGIDVTDCVDSAEGEIIIGENEEHAYIRLKIKPDMYTQISGRLGVLNEFKDTASFRIPGYSGHNIAQKLKNENPEKIYRCFLQGEKAKTRSIIVYLTQDGNGEHYVYLMG